MNKWILFSLTIFVLSCQKKSSSPQSNSFAFDQSQITISAFENGGILCPENNCPSHTVGVYLISQDQFNLGVCSGTLIDSHRILTNAHCIPVDLHKKGSSCQGRLNFYFPKTLNYREEKRGCHQIEFISEKTSSTTSKHPDWAIVSLEKPIERQPVALNFEGIEENSLLTSYKINYELSPDLKLLGTIKKTTCRANSNHLFSQNYLGPQSALFNVSDCSHELTAGHSGSSYLNENQEMIALHSWGSYVLSSNDAISQQLRAQYPNLKQNYGGGTNLACIEALNPTPPLDCHFDPLITPQLSEFYTRLRKASFYNPEYLPQRDQIISMDQPVDGLMVLSDTSQMESSNFELHWKSEIVTHEAKLFFEWLQFSFPQLPLCVKSMDLKMSLQMSFISSLEDSQLDPLTVTEYYPTVVQQKDIFLNFDKDSGEYLMTLNSDLIPSYVVEELGLRLPVTYKIPICQ